MSAAFKKGVLVGAGVQAVVVTGGDEFNLNVCQGEACMTIIQGRLGEPAGYSEKLPALEAMPCRELDFATAAEAHGILPMAWQADAAARLFPTLSAVLPAYQVAALLATTRLVGMHCPGLHSLYSELALQFDSAAAGPPEMAFRADRSDARFRLLRLAVSGPGFTGKLGTFLRPPPQRQASFAELATSVEKGEFAGQRAVVVGGSRGLGEVTAKLLAAGGAQVQVTYHRGRADAESVSAEINAAGGHCGVAEFDSNRPSAIRAAAVPTHLYYFASPRITADKSEVFSTERFALFCEFFVDGFAKTLLRFARSEEAIHVFYPSTVFLDHPVPNMAEYCAAKAAGEEICRQLEHRFPAWRIHAPRLPRMLTDQTTGILPVKTEPAHVVILRELRRMA